jgi:hypothetical protein
VDRRSLGGRHGAGDGPHPAVVLSQRWRGPRLGRGRQLDQDIAAVGGMGAAPYPACPLQPVHQHGDSARGKEEPLAELALGQRTVSLQMLKRVEVSGADAAAAGQCRTQAVARQAEPLQRGGHLIRFHSRHLTPV